MRPHYEGLWLNALSRTVLVPASKRCTIIFNPKSACSTLKFNIWQQEYESGAAERAPPSKGGAVHRNTDTPIPKIPMEEMEAALFGSPVFSLVRNPYARILSSYLQKITTNRKQKRHLLLGMGRELNESVTFGEFVDYISRQNSREMDRHYTPQALLMQVNYLPFAKIGCVERTEESIAAITASVYGTVPKAVSEYRHHRTDAPSRIGEYYTPEIAEKVLHRFRMDFEIFGYSSDIGEAHLPPQNLEGAAQLGREASESVLRPAIRAAVAEEHNDDSAALQLLSSIKSDEPELDAARARLLFKMKREEEAVALLQRVVERVDDVGRYWMQLAECLQALGRSRESVDAADKAVAIAPYPGLMRRAARTWQNAGEKTKASALMNKLTSILETSPKRRKETSPKKRKRLELAGAGD